MSEEDGKSLVKARKVCVCVCRQVVAVRLWKREIKQTMMSAENQAGTLNLRDVFFWSRSNKLCPAGLEESQLIPRQTVEKEKSAKFQSRQVVVLR